MSNTLEQTAELVRSEIQATMKFAVCDATKAHIELISLSFNIYTAEVKALEQQASDKGGDL